MKLFKFVLTLFWVGTTAVFAQDKKITLEEIYDGTFSQQRMESLRSMNNGNEYIVLNQDRQAGTTSIDVYDYKAGQKKRSLLNTADLEDISRFQGYKLSENENKVLLGTEVEQIFRRSSRGIYFVYDVASRSLTKVSENKIQEPTFSPDASKVAFVFDNNIYIKDLSSGEETQVTTDGKRNEIINGVTDWVYEEEFSFVRAFDWNASGNHLAFLRFDEVQVPEFSMDIELRNKTELMEGYYQLHCKFETVDSMGANFINSCLEKFAEIFKDATSHYAAFSEKESQPEVIMSILSNFVPECIVRAEVSCPVEDLEDEKNHDPALFAGKFLTALKIAEIEPYRAVTHNKGIMNGIDAVVLATGNDFRAVEAGIHAYASKDGRYTSLTHASVENGIFRFWMEIPLAVGTVGGLTNLHPLVKVALEILQKPSARELMEIIAVAGLAQNFAAIKSLVTTGIQQGHMKMHLMNILNQQQATPEEKKELIHYFKKHTVTHSSVVDQLEKIRQ